MNDLLRDKKLELFLWLFNLLIAIGNHRLTTIIMDQDPMIR